MTRQSKPGTRRPGRPRLYHEARRDLYVRIPTALYDEIAAAAAASGRSITAVIVERLRVDHPGLDGPEDRQP